MIFRFLSASFVLQVFDILTAAYENELEQLIKVSFLFYFQLSLNVNYSFPRKVAIYLIFKSCDFLSRYAKNSCYEMRA